MSLPNLSGVGRLTADPTLRFAASGTAVVEVSLAFNSRKRDQAGNWVDGDTFYVRGKAFKQLAENVAETLVKGMEVNVSGRLLTEQWQDKNSGEKRSATGLLIDSIGPNLAYATAAVTKTSNGGGSRASEATQSAPADDPWGGAAQDDMAPF